MKKIIVIIGIGALAVAQFIALFLNIGAGRKEEVRDTGELTIVSPHPLEFIKPLINEFERETGIKTSVTQCGTPEAIDLVRNDENVDILWGGSILTVGEYSSDFLPYKSENLGSFQEVFQDTDESITCFTDVPSILIINTDLVGHIKIEGYKDLLTPELKGKIAFADPQKSSSSFEHLTNMIYAMGQGDPDKGLDFVEDFAKQLDGELLDSSSKVYEGVSAGKYLVGLTFEEAAITMIKLDKHIKIVYMNEGIVTTPDGIYINKQTENAENAEKFVDFMTAYDTQLYISRRLGRRSVRRDIEDSTLVTPKEELNIIEVDEDEVIENKSKWIKVFEDAFG